MTTDNQSTTPKVVNQNTYGNGDNIDGNKYVNIYQEIAPKSLHAPIEKILNFVKSKEIENAILVLNTIKSMGNLDSEAIALLDIISVRINILKQADLKNAYQTLVSYYQKKPQGLAADLCIGTLIRLDIACENIESAKERYQRLTSPEIYTQEAYFDLVAGASELQEWFKHEKLYLTEIALCSIVRGSLRLQTHDFTLEAATELQKRYPSFNSQVLLATAKAARLNTKLPNTGYWYITNQLKNQLELLTHDVIILIEKSNGDDERLMPIAASIHQYTMGASDELNDLCCKYIDKIERVEPEISRLIILSNSNSFELSEAIEERIIKAQREPRYRCEIINDITAENSITIENATLLAEIGDRGSIDSWLRNDPKISSGNEFEREFILLELKALGCKDSPQAKQAYEALFESFLRSHENELTSANPFRVYGFSQKLMTLDLSPLAIKLLSNYVDHNDPWPSPPIKLYFNALYASGKHNTLTKVLFAMSDKACDFFTWQLRGVMHSNNSQIKPAIEAFQNAIDINPNITECWYNLISCLKQLDSSDDQIKRTIHTIPSAVLEHPSKLTATILAEAAQVGLFSLAEETMVKWFIQSPESNAIIISNLFSGMTLLENQNRTKIKTSDQLPDGTRAYRLAIDNKQVTKLITFDDSDKNSYTLSHNSPIGSAVLKMNTGGSILVGTQEVTLLEQFSPLVAAYQVSLQLRQAINDGSDCFDMFETPDDIHDLLAVMKKKMQAGDDYRQAIASHRALPMVMKCHRLNISEPVRIALDAMTSADVFKHNLFDSGEYVGESLILDIYSILYFALTGLYQSPDFKKYRFYISEVTLFDFQQWFNRIADPEYLIAGFSSEGEFYRVTSEEIQHQTKDIQKTINIILDKTEIQKANIVDLPASLLRIKDLISPSAYSSMVLSIANNIPWLCIDGQLAQYYSALGLTSFNAQKFIEQLSRSTTLELKKAGIYYYITTGLPYPLTYEEMYQLSESKDECDTFHLAELIYKYPNAFDSSDDANQFIYKLLIPIIDNSNIGNIRKSESIEKIFFGCCRIVISPKDGKLAEEKLAKLITLLIFKYQSVSPHRNFIITLFSKFISGNFLCLDSINHYINNLVASINSMQNTDLT